MKAVNELTQAIAALTANGAAHYDPVRFRFITSMAQRAEQHSGSVASLVISKTQVALQKYQQDVAQAHAKAIKYVQLINQQFPEHSAVAHQYLVASNYRGLLELVQKLQAKPAVVSSLSALTSELLQGGESFSQEPKQETLDDILRQQESDLLHSLATVGVTSVNEKLSPAGGHGELKSVRLFRESWSKIHSEQRLTKSINDAPASAGPLNEQRLMIRSLEMMQELSPKYLSRFVGYVDSLLWLEQAGKKTVLNKAKKKRKKRAG